jgi:hypothetical protein
VTPVAEHAVDPQVLPLGADELAVAVRDAIGTEPDRWSVRRFEYTTSFPLFDLHVVSGDDEVRLVLKDLRWSSLAPQARRAKREEGHDPDREVATYRHLLGDPAGPPDFHGGTARPGAAWLLLEHVVHGRELYQWGELEAWTAAATWLGRFHGTWAEPGRLGDAARRVPLLCHDRAHLARLGRRVLDHRADSIDPADPGVGMVELVEVWQRAAPVLAAAPRTIVHGECYASDVLVTDDGRVAVVDWETTAVGAGWEDLAALVTGWGDDERAAMLDAYLRALPTRLHPPDPELLLDAARLQLAVQWLGADPGWTPPHEHRRDWATEAAAVVTRRADRW